MIYTITLNPALDRTIEIPSFKTGAVNRVAAVRTDPGGKGINVTKVIHKRGGNSVAAGILGGNTGRAILSALNGMGIPTCFYFAQGETRTNIKIVDPVNHTNTDLNEPGEEISAPILDGLLQELLDRIAPGDIAVLSGSVPKGVPADLYFIWTKAFQEKGARVFLDASGPLLEAGVKASPYLMKPNIHEFSALVGWTPQDPEALAEAARALAGRYGIAWTVISLGEKGALYVTEKEAGYARGLKVPVRSTVGAGDSMMAALAVAAEAGMGKGETVRLSMAAGAAGVMSRGTEAAEYSVIRSLVPEVEYRLL